MTPVLIRSLGYLLDLGASVLILLLVLEWLVHTIPGASLNPLRRSLFRMTFPFQKLSDSLLPTAIGPMTVRGLWMAFGFWALTKGLVPWVIWAGFALKGR